MTVPTTPSISRPVKYILIGCGVFILLILAAMAMALALFDPNAHKARIAQLVRDHTGQELSLDGDIKLSVFPWVGVSIGPMHLSSPPAFGETRFVEVTRAEVAVKLLPLISGKVQVKRVDLDGLRLRLITAEDGTTTWGGLSQTKIMASATPEDKIQAKETATPVAALSKAQGGIDLTVGEIRMTDAQVVWEDRPAKARYEISGLNLTTGLLNLTDPTDIALSFKAASADPDLTAAVTLKALAAMDLPAQKFALAKVAFGVKAQGQAVPGGSAALDLTGDLNLDLAAQTFGIKGLVLTAQGLKLTDTAQPVSAKISGDLDLDLKAGIAAARNLTLAALGLTLTGEPVVGFKDGLTVRGNFALTPGNVREALAQLGLPQHMADPKALTAVSAALKLDLTPDQATVSGLDLGLDGSRITGEAKVKDLKAKPAAAFTLAVDALDLDRYLPPKSGEKSADKSEKTSGKEAGAKDQGSGKPGQVIPVETLRGLRVEGSLAAGRLKAANVHMENVELAFKAWDGLVSVKPAKVNLYQGSVVAALALDAAKAEPTTALTAAVSGVNAGPLLKDLLGHDSLQGRVNLNADLRCLGDTTPEMKRSLNGKADFHVKDGVFPGVDFLGLAKAASSGTRSGDAGQAGQGKKTDFGELSGSLTIVNGLITNKDLSLKAPALRATGEGTANLGTEEIDYLLRPKLALTGQGQGGKGSDDTFGLTVPIRISGTFSKPGYGLATGELAKEILSAPVNVAGGLLKGAGAALGLNKTASSKNQPSSSGKGAKDLLGKIFGK